MKLFDKKDNMERFVSPLHVLCINPSNDPEQSWVQMSNGGSYRVRGKPSELHHRLLEELTTLYSPLAE